MVQKNLRKITLAATLTALSIAIDILFKTLIPANYSFGFPFYALPLVVGSLVLGPIFGGVMGFLSDLIGFYSNSGGYTYDILFAFQAMAWGIVPFFIAKRNSSWLRVGIAVLVSHVVATTCSSLADFFSAYVYNGGKVDAAFTYMLGFLPLRLYMMPVNIFLITMLTRLLNERMEPIYIDFIGPISKKSEQKKAN